MKPMYVVFWSETAVDDHGEELFDEDGGNVLIDKYEIVPSKERAEERYQELLSETYGEVLDEQGSYVYAAGYAPVSQATEPQWIDGGS